MLIVDTVIEFFTSIYYYIFDRLILYPLMANLAPKLGVVFMNLGYMPLEIDGDEKNHVHEPNDHTMINTIEGVADFNDPNIPHYYLYEKPLSLHPKYPRFSNLDLLEVSCGQGTGLNWLGMAHPELQKLIGCDRIALNLPRIHYSDAHRLDFPNESFDIILNVESSHLYQNCSAFFAEAKRVLRIGGHLCWADLRFANQISEVSRQAREAGLTLVHWIDVTENILAGIHRTSAHYDMMLQRAPFLIKLFKYSIRRTYCAPGTATYERLANRRRLYFVALWRKDR